MRRAQCIMESKIYSKAIEKITGNAYKKLIRRKEIKEIPEECERVTRKADY